MHSLRCAAARRVGNEPGFRGGLHDPDVAIAAHPTWPLRTRSDGAHLPCGLRA